MERVQATEVLCGSDDETHWAQWLWPHGGIDFEQGYLVLERAVEPEGGDWDTVWASRCSQGYSGYNCIQRITIRPAEVLVWLNPQRKDKLQCGDLLIEFELDTAEYARLVEVLRLVFAGLN